MTGPGASLEALFVVIDAIGTVPLFMVLAALAVRFGPAGLKQAGFGG